MLTQRPMTSSQRLRNQLQQPPKRRRRSSVGDALLRVRQHAFGGGGGAGVASMIAMAHALGMRVGAEEPRSWEARTDGPPP